MSPPRLPSSGISWPRSLLARNALLIIGLVVAGQLVSLAGFFILVQAPRAVQLAAVTARYAAVLESALAAASPEERTRLLALPDFPVARLEAAGPPEGGRRGPRPQLLRRFEEALALRLDGRPIRFTREGVDTLWIGLRVPGERLWFGAPIAPLLAEHFFNWVAVSGAGAVIGLAGAFLIQRRINRPLDALGDAARRVGSGLPAERLDENGPSELAGLARAFNRMTDDLAAVERERAVMLAGISHDVRTPLTRIRLATELLRGQSEPELLARIETNLDRVDRILGQFLAFARDEAAERPVYASIERLVAERVADASEDGASVVAETAASPDLPIRPLALGRAIDNLIGNALAHGRPPVTVSTAWEDGCLVISVRDCGQGIAPEEIERLRQPFQRGAEDAAGSTGLGLAIADRIARLHGGSLAFERPVGGGFVARLLLPT
jgi:two-component system osmolarity sensor histidine kinase EnvZ